MLNRGPFVSRCPPPHLAADTESLQRVQAEPARVSCLSEAVHELCVECPLQGRQTYQDHMFLFRGKLVPQDIMTSSGIKKLQSIFVKIKNMWDYVKISGLTKPKASRTFVFSSKCLREFKFCFLGSSFWAVL